MESEVSSWLLLCIPTTVHRPSQQQSYLCCKWLTCMDLNLPTSRESDLGQRRFDFCLLSRLVAERRLDSFGVARHTNALIDLSVLGIRGVSPTLPSNIRRDAGLERSLRVRTRTTTISTMATASTSIAIRTVDASSVNDLQTVVDVLLRSLTDDQAIDALTDGSKSTAALIFRLAVERSLREGESHLAYDGDEVCGAAVWLAPGYDWRFAEDDYIMSHLSEEMQEWYKHHFLPKYEDLYTSAGVDSTRLRKEAWKLQFLGVLPSYRGKGVRKRLIQVINRKADTENRRALVEVSSPAYVQSYRSIGFIYRAVKNFSSPRYAGFPIWLLIREPESGTPRQI
ncbi:hypothetical protein BDY19DRAFT_185257 [Irpex rosettiformis]|uniref:Uncharacterized protein n=1 Tax=Irpex rosettiformis TaxID=378272 RepID=A0ACB8U222_9APHY|nr:hypothetical protein BDY19DRAFT_185257 [Irpex rosettiformis]